MTADLVLRVALAGCGTVLLVAVAVLRTVPARRLGPALAVTLTATAALLLFYGAAGAAATVQLLAIAAGVALAAVILGWLR